ncbi:NAD(P)H-dependent glycerol-3-phosphate dehydrogenase [Thermophilibacter sp.]
MSEDNATSQHVKVGVIGSGAWGLALARLFSREGHDVTVWSESEQTVERLAATRTIPLPGDPELPANIALTCDLAAAASDARVVVFVTSSRFVRAMAEQAAPLVRPDAVLVCATKGLEEGSMDTMTQVIADELAKARPNVPADELPAVAALSGPSHAEEVAFDMPTAIVAASHDPEAALLVQRLFSGDVLRVYTSDDVHGVELCGAIKNVIALACGIARGLGFGDNSSAALITRGLAEIRRLGTALGCDQETFFGLACTGDLVVTAGSLHSRNLRCGKLIGSGVPVDEARRQVGAVVEGLNALPAVLELSAHCGVEMPICEMVGRIVSGEVAPEDATGLLMGRELKVEGPAAYQI